MNDQDHEEMEALEELPVAPEAMGLPPMMMGAPAPAACTISRNWSI